MYIFFKLTLCKYFCKCFCKYFCKYWKRPNMYISLHYLSRPYVNIVKYCCKYFVNIVVSIGKRPPRPSMYVYL